MTGGRARYRLPGVVFNEAWAVGRRFVAICVVVKRKKSLRVGDAAPR